MQLSPKFITLEGIEGVGKTSCIEFISHILSDHNISFITTREPGSTTIAEQIRSLLLADSKEEIYSHTELMLMFAARNQHINLVIKPALQAGKWVISDRYIDASYAYQVGGRGITEQAVQAQQQLLESYLHPDMTLLLDMDVTSAFERVHTRAQKKDRFERENIAFFERVRQKYLALANNDKQRIKVVDASVSLEQVKQQIRQYLNNFI